MARRGEVSIVTPSRLAAALVALVAVIAVLLTPAVSDAAPRQRPTTTTTIRRTTTTAAEVVAGDDFTPVRTLEPDRPPGVDNVADTDFTVPQINFPPIVIPGLPDITALLQNIFTFINQLLQSIFAALCQTFGALFCSSP